AALTPATPAAAPVQERQVATLMPAPRPADIKSAEAKPAETKSADAKRGASVRDRAQEQQRAKNAVMQLASAEKPEKVEKPPSLFERLFGKWGSGSSSGSSSSSPSALAFASADVSSTSSLGPAN